MTQAIERKEYVRGPGGPLPSLSWLTAAHTVPDMMGWGDYGAGVDRLHLEEMERSLPGNVSAILL